MAGGGRAFLSVVTEEIEDQEILELLCLGMFPSSSPKLQASDTSLLWSRGWFHTSCLTR